MRILVAPDSFKESLSSTLAARAIAQGAKKVFPKSEIIQVPMADGGEGTLEALLCAHHGKKIPVQTLDPLMRKITAHYGLIESGQTAVVEMAQSSGLALISSKKRNPMATSSYGTGALIRSALDQGCKKIILTLGGVATNDAGIGMAQALGFRFLDRWGKNIPNGAQGLGSLHAIDHSGADPRIGSTQFVAACDVKNPLCGPQGSAAVYGPQKGATPRMVCQIEKGLRHFAKIVHRDLKVNILNKEGAGAAGGAGAGAIAFFGARLVPGIEMILQSIRFEEKMRGSDFLITGEGKIDSQTLFGKTISGIAPLAKKHAVPLICFCGTLEGNPKNLYRQGVTAIFPIVRGPTSFQESIRNTRRLLTESVEQSMRLLKSSL